MSFLVQEWVEDAPVKDTYERIILLKLARHADDDGTGTWPAVPTIGRIALCDDKTVKRRLRSLEQRGLIARGDQTRNQHLRRDRRPTVYDVLVPRAWYGDSWDKIMREREEAGRAPIDPATRPNLAAPGETGRATRADKGKPNPKRSPKRNAEEDDGTGGLTDPPDAGGLADPPHGGSNSPSTGGLTDPNGGSNRPPNQSLSLSGGNQSVSSSSAPSPHEPAADAAAVDTEEDEEQPAPRSGSTPAPPVGPLLARFWQQLPAEVSPNSTRRGQVTPLISELLSPPNTWCDDRDGPELLALWFSRRIPRTAVGNPAGWLRSQCSYAPSGPELDQLVPWDNCPEGCDDQFQLTEVAADGTESVRRCPVPHRRDVESRQRGSEAMARAVLGSLETAPAGARSSPLDGCDPPF